MNVLNSNNFTKVSHYHTDKKYFTKSDIITLNLS